VGYYIASHRHIWFDVAGALFPYPYPPSSVADFGKTVKTLLVMGFQRETASRGALAIYTSVCLLHHNSFNASQLFLDCLCCCVGVYRISYNAFCTVNCWSSHNHQLSHLYICIILSYLSSCRTFANMPSADKTDRRQINHRTRF
jgi:hypothetical protein